MYCLIWVIAEQTDRAINARGDGAYKWTQVYIQTEARTVSQTDPDTLLCAVKKEVPEFWDTKKSS